MEDKDGNLRRFRMLESQIEKEPQVKVIEVGKWFNPFLNYYDLPYVYNEKRHQTKALLFLFKPAGLFIIELEWWDRDVKRKGEGKLVLPFGEQTINLEDYSKFEDKLESKLLQIKVDCNETKYQTQELPYKAEINTPIGEVFQSLFLENIGAEGLPIAGPDDWHKNGEVDEVRLLIPEVEQILEKIQMRIVPAEEGKNG